MSNCYSCTSENCHNFKEYLREKGFFEYCEKKRKDAVACATSCQTNCLAAKTCVYKSTCQPCVECGRSCCRECGKCGGECIECGRSCCREVGAVTKQAGDAARDTSRQASTATRQGIRSLGQSIKH